MDLNSITYISVRGLVFIPIFLVIHYSFKSFPKNKFFQIIGGTEESVWQHMKVGFYAYFILSALEFGSFQSSISDASTFWWTHLIGALILPWFILVIWFTAPAVYSALGVGGFIKKMWLEILYANICVYFTILFITIFEGAFQGMQFSIAMKICLLFLLFLMTMEFTVFSFRKPWVDVITAPY
ncbi:MAG: hypothetical protein ACTSWW_03410 [Promethearchaeota archaeon]